MTRPYTPAVLWRGVPRSPLHNMCVLTQGTHNDVLNTFKVAPLRSMSWTRQGGRAWDVCDSGHCAAIRSTTRTGIRNAKLVLTKNGAAQTALEYPESCYSNAWTLTAMRHLQQQ